LSRNAIWLETKARVKIIKEKKDKEWRPYSYIGGEGKWRADQNKTRMRMRKRARALHLVVKYKRGH
jgi:hypothetical protein